MTSDTTWLVALTAGLAWVLVGTLIFLAYRRRIAAERPVLPTPSAVPMETMDWFLGRSDFERRLAVELACSGGGVYQVAVTLFRIDNIEEITEALGETAADLALERVAWSVSCSGHAADVIGQLGRDLCGVIMVRNSRDQADIHARRLREAISGVYLLLGQIDPVPFTVSIGIAHFPEHGKSPGELIQAAQRALKPRAALPGS